MLVYTVFMKHNQDGDTLRITGRFYTEVYNRAVADIYHAIHDVVSLNEFARRIDMAPNQLHRLKERYQK